MKDTRDPEKIGMDILNVMQYRKCTVLEAADAVMAASALAKNGNVLHGDNGDASH